jgi:hypothetical protein
MKSAIGLLRPSWFSVGASLVWALNIGSSSDALAGEMKLKRLWAYEWARFEYCNPKKALVGCPKPFFTCDYTTLTCRRGFSFDFANSTLFVILADDRKTELSHLWCHPAVCLSFDTGEVRNGARNAAPERWLPLTQDIPENCVNPTQECDRWISRTVGGQGYLGALTLPEIRE